MAIRTALLTSKNINLDTDFSKYIETVSEPGVIEGLAVTASSVATGIAWVLCERTNGETIYSLVQNFNAVSISGDGYVIITIPQNIVDNGGGNEDGTGIASIEVVNELPEKNYLLLATITGGVVEDNRNMIKKVWELSTEIDSIFAAIDDLDERVDKLEAADAIDHLEERALVWENYALTDTLFKQLTPKLADSTVEANVWDVAANTEVHIQRLGSGTASNKLKLKVKKTGSPSDIYVEVRKGIKVDVSASEAYWYGDSSNIIATGTLTASTVTTSWQELEFTLDNEFGGTEGELLDIVVYQGSTATVNASNYYVIACDSTQRSEWFSFVSVNGSTRTRSKLMPYCISDGFAQFMLGKIDEPIENQTSFSKTTSQTVHYTTWRTQDYWFGSGNTYYTLTAPINWNYAIVVNGSVSSSWDPSDRPVVQTKLNNTEKNHVTYNTTGTFKYQYTLENVTAWQEIKIVLFAASNNSSTYRDITANNCTITATNYIYKTGIKWLPRGLKDIGNKVGSTIFGIHTDRTRITQDVE